MTADLATRDIVPSKELRQETRMRMSYARRRTLSSGGRRGYYLTRTSGPERDAFVAFRRHRRRYVLPPAVRADAGGARAAWCASRPGIDARELRLPAGPGRGIGEPRGHGDADRARAARRDGRNA